MNAEKQKAQEKQEDSELPHRSQMKLPRAQKVRLSGALPTPG